MIDLTGKSIDRYQILELVEEGGMARVYRARDTRLGRDVAFKIIRTEMFPPAVLQTTLRRFERETKALAQIDHMHIVNIYDYGEYQATPYLVMEYLAGGNLRQRMGKPVPFQQAASYLHPIAKALAYAHRENVIHRDVKPANILFNNHGEPKLSDFGIAKLFGMQETDALTGTSVAIGTPAYMSPEQWSGKTSPASDIYALGVVFYELLTGETPYRSDTPGGLHAKILTESLPDARAVVPNLPAVVITTLGKALAKKPEDRYNTMEEFAEILRRLEIWSGSGIPAQEDIHATLIEPQKFKPAVEDEALLVTHQVQMETTELPNGYSKPEPQARLHHLRLPKQRIKRWLTIAIFIIVSVLAAIYIGRTIFGEDQGLSPPAETVPYTPSSQFVDLTVDSPPSRLGALSTPALSRNLAPTQPVPAGIQSTQLGPHGLSWRTATKRIRTARVPRYS